MAGMTATGTISADYYYNFTTPVGPEGTYEYQATCFYGVGKNASITNSFHLTPGVNNVLGNLSLVLSNQASIQGNITALSDQLNANTSTILSELSNVNSSLYQHITDLNVSINMVSSSLEGNFTGLHSALAGNFSQVQSNFSQVLLAINSINMTGTNVSVDFTSVLSAIDALNVSAQQSFTNIDVALAGNFTQIDNSLSEINTTTQNTYVYMTTTLASNVNSVLSNLGIMNETLNRIETVSGQINATTNAILQNQQDAVVMQVYSG
jgi:hypothetical protein